MSPPEKSESPQDARLKAILKQPLMWKFQFYGFFKNLQFFEPFIIIIFYSWLNSFFLIGILLLIQQVITYVFEIPSGIIADSFGKKTELLICFTFYMGAFIFYFFGSQFAFLVIGSILYGLGEAFRSGTHKAMEMDWMEKEGLLKYKSLIYGRTRSWSLYGSALNSILAIILVLILPADRWIFLAATIPFILDFILIWTYPDYMNEKNADARKSIFALFKENFVQIYQILKGSKRLRSSILSSSSFDAIFKGLKDYIQPIMTLLFGGILLQFFLNSNIEEEKAIKIILGIIYTIFYLFSSFSSRNAYKFDKIFENTPRAYNFLFDVMAGILVLTGLFYIVNFSVGIIVLYLLLYAAYNLRRPLLIGYIGNLAPKDRRATVLSVESQSKSIMTAIIAPLFGWIADFSIPVLFFVIGGVSVLINWGVFRRHCRGDPTAGPAQPEC